MSCTEHFKGVLTPTGKTVKEYVEGITIPSYYSSKEDYFRDVMEDQAFEINGQVYEVNREAYNEYSDIFEATRNDDGTISFQVKYYNGGCGFGEALEEAVKKLRDL